MNKIFFLGFLLLSPLTLLAGDRVTIDSDIWAEPRTGDLFLSHQGLKELMISLENKDGVSIVYPEGEEWGVWAEELKSWFVSLGLTSSRIEVVSSKEHDDIIVVKR